MYKVLECLSKNDLIDLCVDTGVKIYQTKNGKLKSKERLAEQLLVHVRSNITINFKINEDKSYNPSEE